MTVYRSKEQLHVPELDLLTFLFDSPYTDTTEHTIIHLEASNPSVLYTKADGRLYTKRFAHTLRSLFSIGADGPGKDVVTVISSGQAYLPIAFYGVIAAGGVYSAASSGFTASELARQVKDGNSNLIICSSDVLPIAKAAAKQCSIPLDRVLVLESNPVWRLWRANDRDSLNLIGLQRLDWDRPTDLKTLEDRPITLLYSSGTTGVPKGVPLSSRNIVAEAHIPITLLRRHLREREAQGLPKFEYRTLAHLPAAHIAGCQGYFVNPFTAGGLTVWMPKFDFARFLEYNAKFQITTFFTVPPIYLLIAKSPAVKDQFRTLQFCFAGAAPMGADLQRQASERLSVGHPVWISQTWGLSETTGSTTIMPFRKLVDRQDYDYSGSVSPLMPNCEMRIVDEEGRDVKKGQEGEVWMKGPVVFKGYHNREEETKGAFVDGWFCTGDIGVVKGEDELLYIVDRKKELIKYKGLQVAPAELEGLLLSHDLIADAAVIGVPGHGKDEGNELPRAYVVADKSKISEQQIKDFVKENASQHKQLRGGVIFVDAIPKSASGKILRRELRDAAKKELQAKL